MIKSDELRTSNSQSVGHGCGSRPYHAAKVLMPPQRSTQPLVYAAECQAVVRQVMGSSLSGNMLIFQASVLGSGKGFSALCMCLWHLPCQRTPLGCNWCLVHAGSHRAWTEARLVGTWLTIGWYALYFLLLLRC